MSPKMEENKIKKHLVKYGQILLERDCSKDMCRKHVG
jgi:hypothetical protein